MSLTYAMYGGRNRIRDSIPIARDGDLTIYYLDEPIDILREQDPQYALKVVTDLVEHFTKTLNLNDMTTSQLNDLDNRIMHNEPPTDPLRLKIYNLVRNFLSNREGKVYYNP